MGFRHRLYNPEIFQGTLSKRNYFEGWYYKIVHAQEYHALAIIPGISIGREEPDHAFIQVLDGKANKSYYFKFPMEEFSANSKILDIRIGANHFTRNSLIINCPGFTGKIMWLSTISIPSSLFNPGIMGWYSFVPFMECYHGIVSMHHKLGGMIQMEDKAVSFEGGTGYIEKDWGTSFPRCWIWAHSNNFENTTPISLMASVAHIPWLGNYFVGFIVAFLFEGEVKVFATYNGSKKKVTIEEGTVHLSFKRGKEILTITAHPAPGASLYSPIKGIMTGKVNESLQATLELSYFIDEQLVYQGTGTSSGLEVAGDTDILLSENWSSK